MCVYMYDFILFVFVVVVIIVLLLCFFVTIVFLDRILTRMGML